MTESILTIDIVVDAEIAAVVATLTGEIDLSNASRLLDQLAAHHHPGQHLLIDLTAVDYIDSAGLNVLHQLAFSRHTNGRNIGLAYEADSFVAGLLTIAPLPSHVPTGPRHVVRQALRVASAAPSE